MANTLVSIMVPCYNGERHVWRLLDSIIEQSYKHIELIIVDDGSTDNTREVVLSYREKLKEQGIILVYVYQDNRGQAAAINTALKYIHGKYTMWIDADDFITRDHIEKKVEFLERHPDLSVVMCKGIMLDENNNLAEIGVLGDELAVGTLFEDVLLEYRRCTPGLYMVKTSAIFELVGERIVESQVGQNMQLLLPILYENKIGYLSDKLFYYVVRENSHSRSFSTTKDWFERFTSIHNLKIELLQGMQGVLNEEYFAFLKKNLQIKLEWQYIRLLSDTIEESDDKEIVKLIVSQTNLLERMNTRNERDIFIWGACERNFRLAGILENYLGIKIKGYVESKDKQVERYVIKPSKIDKEKMFLLIPLEIHADIAAELKDKSFSETDVYYMKYEMYCGLVGGIDVS